MVGVNGLEPTANKVRYNVNKSGRESINHSSWFDHRAASGSPRAPKILRALPRRRKSCVRAAQSAYRSPRKLKSIPKVAPEDPGGPKSGPTNVRERPQIASKVAQHRLKRPQDRPNAVLCVHACVCKNHRKNVDSAI